MEKVNYTARKAKSVFLNTFWKKKRISECDWLVFGKERVSGQVGETLLGKIVGAHEILMLERYGFVMP